MGGKKIYDAAEILKTQADFYAKLYSVESNSTFDNLDYDRYLTDINILTLSGDHRIECDREIKKDEMCKAVQDLPNNKRPGPDGIPI